MSDTAKLRELVGAVVAERWKITDLIGTGGMAGVFRARDRQSGAEVAIKLLRPKHSDANAAKRFARESRMAARLQHPHIVQTLASGRWNDRLYLVMELVDGLPLDALLAEKLPIPMVISLARQVLDALAHVHARGVLHRDIKPENVLVHREPDGRLVARLADFGIATALVPSDDRLTQAGMIIGTPAYMAPEQILGSTYLGPEVDIYALGTILYEYIAGHLPWPGPQLPQLYSRVNREAPRLEVREELDAPDALLDVIHGMIRRDVKDRFGTAAAARHALGPFAESPTIQSDIWRLMRQDAGNEEVTPGSVTIQLQATIDEPARVLWGRGRDRAALRKTADEALSGSGRVVLVTGPAGVGKTALVDDVCLRLVEAGRFLPMQVHYQQAVSADVGIRGAFARMLGVSGRRTDILERSVRAYLSRFDAETDADVDDLMTFLQPGREAGGGEERQGRAFALVVRMLRMMSSDRPVLLTLDDLPLAGAGGAQFLEHLLFELTYESFPVLVVATLRDGAGDGLFRSALARTDRYEATRRHTMRLELLTEDVLRAGLVRTLGIPDAAARRIAGRSGGNPLFARHLAEAWQNRGVTADSTESPAPRAEGGEVLPDVLASLLDKTLTDRLDGSTDPKALRDFALRLAVLGERVQLDFLDLAFPDLDEIDDVLDELCDLDILADHGPGGGIGFAHGLYRDALLAGVRPRRLARVHAWAAEAHQRQPTAVVEAEAGAVGDHLAGAGKQDDAVEWWLRALAYEQARGDAVKGLEYGRKSLALLPDGDGRRVDCSLSIARLLRGLGELHQAVAVLEPLLGDALADDALVAGEFLGELYQELGAGDVWRALLERLATRRSAAGPIGRRALLRAQAFLWNNQGEFERARQAASEALESSPPGREALRAAIRLTWACKLMGDADGALAAADAAVEAAQEEPELLAEALRMQFLTRKPEPGSGGVVSIAMKALDLHRRSGRAGKVVRGLADVATALMGVGDLELALQRFGEAGRLAASLGLGQEGLRVQLFGSTCRVLLGDGPSVLEEMPRFEDKWQRSGFLGFMPLLYLLHATAAASDDEIDEALAQLEKAGQLDRPPFSREFAPLMAMLGRHLQASGRADAAEAAAHASAAAAVLSA